MKNNKWLIIGLGNPEIKYENNRHNIGYKLVDYILNKSLLSIKRSCRNKFQLSLEELEAYLSL